LPSSVTEPSPEVGDRPLAALTPAGDAPPPPAVGEAPSDDAAADIGAATLSALAATLDFTVDVLPVLRIPLAGAPELEQVDADPSARPIAPITARPRTRPMPTVHFSLVASPTRLATLEDGSAVELHIDGLPGAPSIAPWHVTPVLPTSIDPNAFSMGARWAIDDRIQVPLLDAIAWHAQADFSSGAAPDRGTTVIRRSLRLTARWDRPEDFSLGLTQGVQVGGGTAFDHYATGVTASLFETPPSPFAHWSTFVELTGEHIALNNLAQNYGATVNAGAAFQASASTDFQVFVSRGLAPTAIVQSSVGLSLHF
jgi:hypothetical protein